jgi:hypothetical protein
MLFLFKEHNTITVEMDTGGNIQSQAYPADMCTLISLWLDHHNMLSFLSLGGGGIFVFDSILVKAEKKEKTFRITLTQYKDSSELVEKIRFLEKQAGIKSKIVSYLFSSILALTTLGAVLSTTSKNTGSTNVFTVVNGLNPILAAVCGYYFSESKRDG